MIEREWLQAGHPFPIRHQKSCYSPSNSRSKNNAPTFLLFLDCLAQIHNQFPCSFEFNHDFLIALFEHSYSSQFGKFIQFYLITNIKILHFSKFKFFSLGTFLGTCEADRDRLKLSEKTVSLWSYLNRPEILHSYLNCMYDPNNNVIWPSVAPMSLVSILLKKIIVFFMT